MKQTQEQKAQIVDQIERTGAKWAVSSTLQSLGWSAPLTGLDAYMKAPEWRIRIKLDHDGTVGSDSGEGDRS